MLSSLMVSLVASLILFAHPQVAAQGINLSVPQTACLAEAIYFESRGEGTTGEAAVAYVVLNRTIIKRTSICGVVHAHDQFSYYHPGRHLVVTDRRSWLEAIRIAIAVELHSMRDPVGNATFYNTTPFHGLHHVVFVRKVRHQYFYAYSRLQRAPPLIRQVRHTVRIKYPRRRVILLVTYHRSLCRHVLYKTGRYYPAVHKKLNRLMVTTSYHLIKDKVPNKTPKIAMLDQSELYQPKYTN